MLDKNKLTLLKLILFYAEIINFGMYIDQIFFILCDC